MNGGRRHSTRLVAVLLPSLLALALPLADAAGADVAGKVIGHGVRLKGTNVWFADGKAVGPKTMSAHVTPVPAQTVKVQWAVVCQKPNKSDPSFHLAAKGTSGTTSLQKAGTVKLRLPYPKPHTCVATVYATLRTSGRLTLRLLQT